MPVMRIYTGIAPRAESRWGARRIKSGIVPGIRWYRYHLTKVWKLTAGTCCVHTIFTRAVSVSPELSYLELYQRLFNQKGNKFVYTPDGTVTDKLDDMSFYNILLVVAVVMTYAVDTSICERGFALMNNLKTARRSRMGNLLLRTLMTICELGIDWKDASKIPVEEIVEEWRSQSTRGRYESAMWRAAGLEELNAKGSGAASSSTAAEEVGDADQGGFQYNWAARERARERAFPRARPGPGVAGSPEGADTDGDEA